MNGPKKGNEFSISRLDDLIQELEDEIEESEEEQVEEPKESEEPNKELEKNSLFYFQFNICNYLVFD